MARVSALEDKTKNLDVDRIMKQLASLQENKADKADLDKFYKDLNAKFEQLFKQLQQLAKSVEEIQSKLGSLSG